VLLATIISVLAIVLVGSAVLRMMVPPRQFPLLIDAVAWPAFWLITLVATIVMFGEDIRQLLRDTYSIETPWLKLCRAAQAAAGQKEVPLPPPSAKQQILNEWQRVHDRLAEIYEEKTHETAPARYRPLASRLKSQGYVTGKTGILLDEVRNTWREVRKQRERAVPPYLAEYYAKIVSLLLELLNTQSSRDS
jgi:hypothetical protein